MPDKDENGYTITYQIKITRERTERRSTGKEWMKGADPSKPDAFGYTPEIDKKVRVSHTLLEQTVDTLDLPAVIKAINGIP